MSKSNKATRDKAIPFLFTPYEAGGADADYWGYTLLGNPTLTEKRTKTIPLSQPAKGDIVEAFLFMRMIAPSDKRLAVYIGIGEMTSEVPTIEYSDSYIRKSHEAITGTSEPFTAVANGTLVIEANLLPHLPKRGEAGYWEHGFALLVTFDLIPDASLSYKLDKFICAGSIQMGANR